MLFVIIDVFKILWKEAASRPRAHKVRAELSCAFVAEKESETTKEHNLVTTIYSVHLFSRYERLSRAFIIYTCRFFFSFSFYYQAMKYAISVPFCRRRKQQHSPDLPRWTVDRQHCAFSAACSYRRLALLVRDSIRCATVALRGLRGRACRMTCGVKKRERETEESMKVILNGKW